MKFPLLPPLVLVLILQLIPKSTAQQPYVDNKQLDCDNNFAETDGYTCNGVSKSCLSYLTFRTNPTYNSPVTVAFLLNADPSQIAKINNVSDVDPVPDDTLLIVPLNCSCFSPTPSKSYYQHNTSYVLKLPSETYFSVANNTYESLTTCQAMKFQNPYDYRALAVGMKLVVPLRCACPTKNQTDDGVKYLLSYPVAQGDNPSSIGRMFGVAADDILAANEIPPPGNLIYFFTQLLIPLKSEPKKIEIAVPPPSPSPPLAPSPPTGDGSNKTGLYVGVGVGSGFLLILIAVFLFFFLRRRRENRRRKFVPGTPPPKANKHPQLADYSAFPSETSNSWSISSEGVRYAIGSLTLYKFDELEKATGSFSESNRIRGSVYRASVKGDSAAVKVMRGDVSDEINILKQINHSNIIRLSGFCVHDGNTYLVYEFAENGAVSDYLHEPNSKTTLSWKQRVQIAYDVADALNYLHNYTNPPYIHKNLKSSNILLDLNFRAKLSNFGLARTFGEEDEGMHLTKHVVGTFGYMAPEYIENGLITPKLDVYAFGVVILELLSGREAAGKGKAETEEGEMLAEGVRRVLGGDNVREKLRGFVDGSLGSEYPFELAYSLAEIAKSCVAYDINDRPNVADVLMNLSKVLSSSLDWDSSIEFGYSRSLEHGR